MIECLVVNLTVAATVVPISAYQLVKSVKIAYLPLKSVNLVNLSNAITIAAFSLKT